MHANAAHSAGTLFSFYFRSFRSSDWRNTHIHAHTRAHKHSTVNSNLSCDLLSQYRVGRHDASCVTKKVHYSAWRNHRCHRPRKNASTIRCGHPLGSLLSAISCEHEIPGFTEKHSQIYQFFFVHPNYFRQINFKSPYNDLIFYNYFRKCSVTSLNKFDSSAPWSENKVERIRAVVIIIISITIIDRIIISRLPSPSFFPDEPWTCSLYSTLFGVLANCREMWVWD